MTTPENQLPAAVSWLTHNELHWQELEAISSGLRNNMQNAIAVLSVPPPTPPEADISIAAYNACARAQLAITEALRLWPAPQAVPMPGTAPVPEEPEPEQWWLNKYEHCGQQWEDEWSCCCNDDCPVCGAEIEPYESEEIDKQEA